MSRHRDPPLSVKTMLWLQTTAGNRAVQRLLERQAALKVIEQQSVADAAEPRQLETITEPARGLQHHVWWWQILLWLCKKRTR